MEVHVHEKWRWAVALVIAQHCQSQTSSPSPKAGLNRWPKKERQLSWRARRREKWLAQWMDSAELDALNERWRLVLIKTIISKTLV